MNGDQIEWSKAVTPNDSADFSPAPAGAILVPTSGDVKVTYQNGQTDTVYLAAGVWHKMHIKRVWDTGTTPATANVGYLT